jgi:hypothetical protein
LAGQVLLKIVFLLMRRLFSLTVLAIRGDAEKNAELPALRRENAVLGRNACGVPEVRVPRDLRR